MRKAFMALGLAVVTIAAVESSSGQEIVRVRFPRGSSSSVIKGTVRGYAYRDYKLRATAGQNMVVELTSAGVVPVFSVFLPVGDNLEGATQINDYSGTLPVTGEYVIRVGVMRAAARRPRSVSSYILKISIE